MESPSLFNFKWQGGQSQLALPAQAAAVRACVGEQAGLVQHALAVPLPRAPLAVVDAGGVGGHLAAARALARLPGALVVAAVRA
jgi:hypothetical protein